MFFVRVGSVVAWLMTIFGFVRLCTAIYIAMTLEGDAMIAASRRYLSTSDLGSAIDGSAYTVFAGIALGLLVQIAKNR
ncbi:MAG: hypothetical protein AAFY73_08805 [Pseudomonadota bacterium]